MDKKLSEKLELIKEIKLSDEAKQKGFDFIMDNLPEESFSADMKQKTAFGVFSWFYSIRFVYAVMAVLILFLGGGYIQAEIEKSLSNDGSLYTIKRSLEKAQITLSFTQEKKAQVAMKILEKRTDEIGTILEKKDKGGEKIQNQFKKVIKTTKDDVKNLKKYAKKGNNDTIQEEAVEKALKFKIVLEDVVEKMPEYIEDELKKEIEQLNSELEGIIDGNPADTATENDLIESDSVNDLNTENKSKEEIVEYFDTTSMTATSTTSTLPVIGDDGFEDEDNAENTENGVDNSDNMDNKTEFSIEEDTFKVYIGK